MEKMNEIAFQIISLVGEARSIYVESIKAAKDREFDKATEMHKVAEKLLHEGHKIHFNLLRDYSSGENTEITLLLVHAEDLLSSSESFKIMSEEFITLYVSLDKSGIKF